jgi:hypothetical protein
MREDTRDAEVGVGQQSYGVLATRLDEAVRDVRRALEEHQTLLPMGRLADFDRLLEELARRRVRIAIYGEVKAGKSTLLNAIAGAELSPVAFDPLTSIPVRVTYGPQTSWRVGDRVLNRVDELTRMMREGPNDAQEVVVETPLDLLQLGGQVDLLDSPGVGADARFDAISADVLRSLDAVVLVVRYPALFTQMTRRLMVGLEADIGKLFVVWNLDAACAELSPEELQRHAEILRKNVAGAHELHKVDARAALRAAQNGDAKACNASGLPAFVEALGAFASSRKREVVALREAAKRARGWVEQATEVLKDRHALLDKILTDARIRLRTVQSEAQGKTDAVHSKLAAFKGEMEQVAARFETKVGALAKAFRRRLRASRRRWIRTADTGALEGEVKAFIQDYADSVAAATADAVRGLDEAARRFGAEPMAAQWTRSEMPVDVLAPEDRVERARTGRAVLLRRAIWRRWYLPGLTTLERGTTDKEVDRQRAWLVDVERNVEEAAGQLLDLRLAEISAEAERKSVEIKIETEFEAREAELLAIERHLPIVRSRCESVEAVSSAARRLI